MLKIYLDTCCLNRPFDDQKQYQIRLESEAIIIILLNLYSGKWEWIGSEIIDLEINKTPNVERKYRLKLLSAYINKRILIQHKDLERVKNLQKLGFHLFDALHIACAESAKADILLTTDKKFLSISHRNPGKLSVMVQNPLTWLMEVGANETR